MSNIKSFLLLIIFTTVCIQAQIDDKEKNMWDVSNPEGEWNFKNLKLSTNEGTWMNLDVSPDGTQITFDLLGDIYIMPINGGKAKILREGLPFEVQPRFSPNGSKISFTSDAGGGDNIWIMDIDGSNPKQITKETFRLLNNAIWTPDSNYLIARKHFTSERSAGAGELWMYHITGGDGLQITKRKMISRMLMSPLYRQMESIYIIVKMFILAAFFNITKTQIIKSMLLIAMTLKLVKLKE